MFGVGLIGFGSRLYLCDVGKMELFSLSKDQFSLFKNKDGHTYPTGSAKE